MKCGGHTKTVAYCIFLNHWQCYRRRDGNRSLWWLMNDLQARIEACRSINKKRGGSAKRSEFIMAAASGGIVHTLCSSFLITNS